MQCRCALWCKGRMEGKPYEKSLKTRSFKRAEQILKELQDGKKHEEPKKEDAVTIERALTAFTWRMRSKKS